MIEQWKLDNFKSVQMPTSLKIAPLTIFCGANSSGKSTFLQSILLIAQTLTRKVDSRSVVLNGTMVKLGRFDDLKNDADSKDKCVIGWKCGHSFPTIQGGIKPAKGSPSYMCSMSLDTDDFTQPDAINQIQPSPSKARISISRGDTSTQESYLTIKRIQNQNEYEKKKSRFVNAEEALLAGVLYEVCLDPDSLSEISGDDEPTTPEGCILNHFLPVQLVLEADRADMDIQMICTLAHRGSLLRWINPRHHDVEVPDEIVQLILDIDKKIGGTSDDEKSTSRQEGEFKFLNAEPVMLRQIQRALVSKGRQYYMKMNQALTSQDLDFESQVRDAVMKRRTEKIPSLVPQELPRFILEACRHFDRYFSNSVRYLGPLRDDPKVLHPSLTVTDPTDVGLKGEFTAAVLELHKDRQIRYVPPSVLVSSKIELYDSQESVKEDTLENAVVEWLQYLGVAGSFEIQNRGKLGLELAVQSPGSQGWHDLTNVGVGVSQLLPILVTGLLAGYNTTLVFEQPELHLHPKVQAMLGDFFLSLTCLGIQCLVETHSEHLINRIRLRVAQSSSGSDLWDEALKIYFVEKKGEGSTFQPVKVNDFGAIVEWPDGFFDQSQLDSEEILLAAIEKRRARS